MWLAGGIDIIAIAARVAIILVTADDGSDDAAYGCANAGACRRADAGED
jgi:hypothetical protein